MTWDIFVVPLAIAWGCMFLLLLIQKILQYQKIKDAVISRRKNAVI